MKQLLRSLFFFLLLLFSENLIAQSLEVTQAFRRQDYVSVLAIYKNEFGKYEKPLLDDPFRYAVIRVEMDSTMNEHDVIKAKEMLNLYLGYMHQVHDVYKGNNNEILFLVPSGIRNVYMDCGEGCLRQVLFEGGEALVSNAVYYGRVHYTPAKKRLVDPLTGPKYQFFTFHVTPADAMVEVLENGKWELWPVDNGIATKMLSHGNYRYAITANRFHREEGVFNVSDADREKTISMRPMYGWLNIDGDAEVQGAFVYATNTATGARQSLGRLPIRNKDLDSGDYQILIQQNKYKDYRSTIAIRDGETTTLRPMLEANYAHVELSTMPNAGIYLNNERIGSGTWHGTLEYGDYVIETRLEHHKSVYTNIRVEANEAQQRFALKNPIPVCGLLIINGSPSEATVYVDDKQVGTTPLVINDMLIGNHTVRITKSGYETYSEVVTIKEKQEYSMSYSLNNQVPVVIQLKNNYSSAIYIRPLHGTSSERFLGQTSWSGSLPIGEYEVRTSQSGCRDAITRIYVGASQKTHIVDAPIKLQGSVNFTSTPSGSTVYLNSTYKGITPFTTSLAPGTYMAYASRNGYETSKMHTVEVRDGQTEAVDFYLKKKRKPIVLTDNFGPYHLLEVQYGCGLRKDEKGIVDHYVGLTYGYSPCRFGLNTSINMGIETKDIGISAGPTLRLTDMYSEFNLQFMLGAGMVIRPHEEQSRLTWGVDAGFRFSFEEDSDLAWYTFSLGARYYDNIFIPTASVSLFPARLLYLAAVEEEDFPCIYTDVQSGYVFSSNEWLLGAQCSYIPSHLGIGASFMVGFNGGWDATIGPVFRLTPDDTILDLQVYQGFGYGSYDHSGFIAETGLRFAFGYNNPYWGLWSIDVGCLYNKHDVAITFGLSIPIIGLVGTCGLAGIFL